MFKLIEDFVEDLNYRKILLNLQFVDKKHLKQKLIKDNLNKVYRLEKSNYLWVENCDYQGEEIIDHNDVNEMIEEGFEKCNLYYANGLGYFTFVFTALIDITP